MTIWICAKNCLSTARISQFAHDTTLSTPYVAGFRPAPLGHARSFCDLSQSQIQRTHRRGVAYWRQLHGGERSAREKIARRPEQGIRPRTSRNSGARPEALSVAAEVS